VVCGCTTYVCGACVVKRVLSLAFVPAREDVEVHRHAP